VESVGNPKGCPSDVGPARGGIHRAALSTTKNRRILKRKEHNMTQDTVHIGSDGIVEARKRKNLSAQEKWQIFLETTAKDAPVGEILRRHGLYSSDLTKIRKQVESGALTELGRKKYSKKPCQVSREEYDKIKAELSAKEKALAQMGEEYLILKKRTD
jgi:transposase-like protein